MGMGTFILGRVLMGILFGERGAAKAPDRWKETDS